MKLCDHCGRPEALHLGYDHGAGRCLVAWTFFDLSLRYGPERARVIAAEARAWAAEEEARRDAGAGI